MKFEKRGKRKGTMDRKREILEYISGKGGDAKLLGPAVEEFVYMEGQLTRLRGLPFIRVNPKNPSQQKATPAARLYKEMLQQYSNVLKILQRAAGDGPDEEESPLRAWARTQLEKEGANAGEE